MAELAPVEEAGKTKAAVVDASLVEPVAGRVVEPVVTLGMVSVEDTGASTS